MAWLEQHPKAKTYQLVFRLGGTKFKRSLKTDDLREAEGRLARLKENLRLVDSGRLVLPEHADPAAFLLSDGKLNGKPRVAERLALSQLIVRYRAALPEGALEPESLRIAELHIRHFVRILGVRKALGDINLDELQRYVLKRSREPGKRGVWVSVGTIRKELATLTTLWNWAVQHNYVAGPLPKTGLKFPKLEEHPPFQTYDQISRHVKRGRLTTIEEAQLWDCLYLSTAEVEELLAVVGERADYKFLYGSPVAVVFVACAVEVDGGAGRDAPRSTDRRHTPKLCNQELLANYNAGIGMFAFPYRVPTQLTRIDPDGGNQVRTLVPLSGLCDEESKREDTSEVTAVCHDVALCIPWTIVA
jgi:hypothetical protein